jgi:hypothetical protein
MTEVTSQSAYDKRTTALLHLGGLATSLLYFGLTSLSFQDNAIRLSWFYSILGAAWAIFLLLYFYSRRGEADIRIWVIILWAVIFRLIALGAIPIYEDDYYRFLLDGWVFANRGSPYDLAPLELFSTPDLPLFIHDILDRVNYPYVPTIYGPTLEYVFLLGYLAAPGKLLALKACFFTADLILLGLIAKFFKPRHLLFYAWCPLLLVEITFNAHPDIIGTLFLFAGYIAFSRHRGIQSMIYCGIAVAAKPFALIAAPFFAWRAGWRGLAIFALTLFVLYVPFIIQSSSAELNGLRVFLNNWEFNSALFAVFQLFLSPGTAKILGLSLFTFAFGLLFLKWTKKVAADPPLAVLIGLFFLFSPVINPWYLVWLVPFVAIKPRCWSVTALGIVSLSYTTGLNLGDSSLGDFNHPGWLRPIEFGAISLAIIFDIILAVNRKRQT